MKVHGSCHCGDIRYEAEIDPAKVTVCNCHACQVLTGTGFRVSVPAPAATFRWLSGKPTTYLKTAESGNVRRHMFCPRCGSPVAATANEDQSSAYTLRIGGLAEKEQLPPKLRKWCSSALAWAQDISGVRGIEAETQ